MIVLSDCLQNVVDEGCIKVANSLVRRMKAAYPETMVISYKRKPEWSALHMKLNPFMLNGKLLLLLKRKREPVLYIPFSGNTSASIVRTWVLSRVCNGMVLFAGSRPMSGLERWILRTSGMKVICLSEEMWRE